MPGGSAWQRPLLTSQVASLSLHGFLWGTQTQSYSNQPQSLVDLLSIWLLGSWLRCRHANQSKKVTNSRQDQQPVSTMCHSWWTVWECHHPPQPSHRRCSLAPKAAHPLKWGKGTHLASDGRHITLGQPGAESGTPHWCRNPKQDALHQKQEKPWRVSKPRSLVANWFTTGRQSGRNL